MNQPRCSTDANKKRYLSLWLGNADAKFLEGGEELAAVNLSVTVEGVHDAEGSAQSSNRLGSSRIQLLSEAVQYYNDNR